MISKERKIRERERAIPKVGMGEKKSKLDQILFMEIGEFNFAHFSRKKTERNIVMGIGIYSNRNLIRNTNQIENKNY